jgi:hypothetical protein
MESLHTLLVKTKSWWDWVDLLSNRIDIFRRIYGGTQGENTIAAETEIGKTQL